MGCTVESWTSKDLITLSVNHDDPFDLSLEEFEQLIICLERLRRLDVDGEVPEDDCIYKINHINEDTE